MTKFSKPFAAILIAVLALSLATYGTAVAAPAITKSVVKQLAKKQIQKAAPTLAVDKANSATTAATATNANALGGKSLAQLQPVLAGAQNSTVVDIGGGTDVVTLNYTLAAASRVNFSGLAELDGDGGTTAPGDEAACVIRNDGVTVSLTYEASFDDIGTDNPSANVVLASVATVAAGAHIAVMRCTTNGGTGPITKDDAAINIIAVPN